MKFLIIPMLFLISTFGDLSDLKDLKKFLSKAYVEIPSGIYSSDGKRYSIQGFYIYKTEISVLDYKEFLADLKGNSNTELYKLIAPKSGPGEKSSFPGSYYEHPAFHEYPAIGISINAAQLYCKWLEGKLVENFGLDASMINVRIPTKSEWIYTAKGGNDQNIYGWNGPYLRNENGEYLANFKKEISQELISYDELSGSYIVKENEINTSNALTSPVKSFQANDFGVYNMSGNVAELVMDNMEAKVMGGSYNSPGYDIRVTSELAYEKADLYTGFRPLIEIKS